MNFIEAMNEFGKKVESKFDKINWGGCAVFAAIVGEKLEEQRIPTRIRVGYMLANEDGDDVIPLEEIREQIAHNSVSEWCDQGVIFGHLIVEFDLGEKTYHYDTSGVYPKSYETHEFSFPLYCGAMSVKDCRELADQPNWNRMFDRDSIPEIQQMADKFFSKKVQQALLAA